VKILITLKDPDSMPDAVTEAFKRLPKPDGVSQDEWNLIWPSRRDAVDDEITRLYMAYSEYIYLEYDTDTKLMRVVPREEFDD
jgi:hypothetical protein